MDDTTGTVDNRKEQTVYLFKFLRRQHFPKQGTKGMNQKGKKKGLNEELKSHHRMNEKGSNRVGGDSSNI